MKAGKQSSDEMYKIGLGVHLIKHKWEGFEECMSDNDKTDKTDVT